MVDKGRRGQEMAVIDGANGRVAPPVFFVSEHAKEFTAEKNLLSAPSKRL